MANKPPFTIAEQLALLKQRGLLFQNEKIASQYLKNISYYRLKGYWWDMQEDTALHYFKSNSYFEDVIRRYNFDRQLRLILFDAIERIEIGLRTKMTYQLSHSFTGLWYLDTSIFEDTSHTINGIRKSIHLHTLDELKKEFNRSQEVFIKDHRNRFPNLDADAWKIMEVASLGTLSKLYKNLQHQLPEKSRIAKEMGLNLHSELSSWLESITYVRNIIAHHSRLWNRNMVKRPVEHLNNPSGNWFTHPLVQSQSKKPYLIISCMIYLCNHLSPEHPIKTKILELISKNPNLPVYKLGFINDWRNEPLWL
ncbi:MAG: Abi family protein [Bacteroidia bacterium]